MEFNSIDSQCSGEQYGGYRSRLKGSSWTIGEKDADMGQDWGVSEELLQDLCHMEVGASQT